jgi:hypothetical protein
MTPQLDSGTSFQAFGQIVAGTLGPAAISTMASDCLTVSVDPSMWGYRVGSMASIVAKPNGMWQARFGNAVAALVEMVCSLATAAAKFTLARLSWASAISLAALRLS